MSEMVPLPLRQLRAEMATKGLSMKSVSERSKVNYITCSLILNGRQIHPENLAKIRAAIASVKLPKEAAR